MKLKKLKSREESVRDPFIKECLKNMKINGRKWDAMTDEEQLDDLWRHNREIGLIDSAGNWAYIVDKNGETLPNPQFNSEEVGRELDERWMKRQENFVKEKERSDG